MLNEVRLQAQQLANWGAILTQLQAIAQLTTDVEALIVEIETLNEGWTVLVTSGTALCTIDEAVAWKGQALQWQNQGFAMVRTAQRLMGRTLSIMASLQTILSGIIGTTSGAQSSNALLAVIAANITELHSLTASFQSATMGKDVIEMVTGIHLVCIHGNHLSGWGSYSR